MTESKRTALAIERFLGPYNCAQSVFSAFAGEFGLEEATALKIAGAFGAGIAYTGETCGAVTGALMVIGLKHGKASPEDEKAKERCNAKARMFMDQFLARRGALQCRQLTGYDLSRPGEVQSAKAAGIFTERCPAFVLSAVEILEEIL